MDYSVDMQIIEFDSFETAFPVQPGKESAVKRRFMTLFTQDDEHAQVGGTSYVCKASSFTGEQFAVKRLLASAGIPQGANLTPEDTARITQGHAAAFYEEYKNQLLVSRMRGFPKLYGYGMIGDDPAIVMEWVEGVSVRDIARTHAERGEVVPVKTIAALGASVLEVLDTAGRLDSTLVHRDISPANIMVRTDEATVEEQAERGFFDVCLIDFGSASADTAQDASFTMVSHVWRNGTPEYAPPEMLTQDIPHIDRLRKSQAIDVFALCSVLYELYVGHTPWRVGEHSELSPFRIKTERAPESVTLRDSGDEPFVEALLSGLEVDQKQRPSVQQLLAVLLEFAPVPAEDGEDVEGASEADGTVSGGRSSAPRRHFGHGWMPTGLYTPDSTRLKVATTAEGGRRAGEEIEPFVRQPTLFTRRNLVVGGLVLLAAAAGGALAARSCQPEAAYDFSNYPTTDSIYSGDSLYPVMHMRDSAWLLRDVRTGSEIALGTGNREPGKIVAGLMKAYDPATGNYGFMTAVASGAGAGSGSASAGSMNAPEASGSNIGSSSGTATGSSSDAASLSSSSNAQGAESYTCAWRILPTFADAGDFSQPAGDVHSSDAAKRLAAVKDSKSGLWGYINGTGDQVIQPSFADAARFSWGYAPVLLQGSSLWALINEDGKQVIGPRFIGLGVCSDVGLLAAAEQSGRKWGFVDSAGEWVIPDDFAQVRRFSEGLAACRRKGDGLWEYVDTSGNTVVEARFSDAFPFVDGLAPAKDPDSQLWGLIDESGSWRVTPRCLSLGEKVGALLPAHGSPANVYDIYEADKDAWDAYKVSGGDRSFGYGFMDETGEWAVKPIYADVLIRQPEQ